MAVLGRTVKFGVGEAPLGVGKVFWLAVGVAFVLLFLYQSTFLFLFDLWSEWEDGEYSHGFLIVLISFYLLWRQSRQPNSELELNANLYLFVLIAAASAMWGLAILANVHMIETFVVIFIFVMCVLALVDKRHIRALLFPLLYLFLAVPIWLPLLPLLQTITTHVVYNMINLLGVPAIMEGHVIHVPGGSFAVELACSGLRYFLSALALSSLYGYLTFRHVKVSIYFVLGALAIAIVANWLRVLTVIYAGYKTGMTHPWVHDHINLGWYFFAGMIFPYLWFGVAWFERLDKRLASVKTGSKESAKAIPPQNNVKLWLAVAALIVTASVGPMFVYIGMQQVEARKDQSFEFPVGEQGWDAAGVDSRVWRPQSKGADAEAQRVYLNENDVRVDVYLSHYAYSRDGAEPIDHSFSLFSHDQWRDLKREQRINPLNRGVIELDMISKENGEKRVVWYWYVVAGKTTNNIVWAKFYEIWAWMAGGNGISIMAISARYQDDPVQAEHQLKRFLGDMGDNLTRQIVESFG